MAINQRTLALLRQLRTDVGLAADDAVRDITKAWVESWDLLAPMWQQAIADVLDVVARSGRWPSAWQLARIPTVAAATASTEQETAALALAASATIVTAGTSAVAATVAAEPAIIASQLPAALIAAATAAYAAKLSTDAIAGITSSVGERITALIGPLGATSAAAVGAAVVRGTRAGDGATTPSRDLMARLEGAFTAGLNQAVTTARTEVVDAMRATSAYVHRANGDVLRGWMWIADVGSTRCCPSCYSMHGRIFPLDVPGPLDHQQGRCGRIPALRRWADLSVAGEEPDDAIPDGLARFRKLSRADQLKVMGATRLQLLDDGDIGWADLATRRDTNGWRPSYVPRTITDLKRLAGRRNR